MTSGNSQKWEYDFVLGQPTGNVSFVNGKKLSPPFPSLFEYLNQLGAEGWELVAVDNNHYILKRPK